ncbi:ABC transporter ATP-binding protein [Evtepia sp.]|uniref:ABC transporter ATP-binding protein n=1 Tax=Evtepia sp. TaxID=2773933 RepID=UPI003F188F75
MLLTAEHISLNFGLKQLLDDVTLYLNEGDKIGIIGINGTGKSSFLRILAGEQVPDEGKVTLDPNVQVSFLSQNPNMDENATVLEQVFADFSSDVRALMEYEAKTMLTRLGITDFDQKVGTLSGGQRKRVALAAVLLHPADVLILDEPTNHLDSDMVLWLEGHLQKFTGGLIMVTHDRYFLERVSNRITELSHCHIRHYEANYSKYLELKTQQEEMEQAAQRKRQSILRVEYQWIMRGAQARRTKNKDRIARYEELKAQTGPETDQSVQMATLSSRLGRKTVELKDVSKSFGDKKVLDHFSYGVARDDRVGIVGRNGAGKSTLLNLIAGKIFPDSGTVDWGETVRIGYFSQEGRELDLNQRVYDFIHEIAGEVKTREGNFSASQMMERFLFPTQLQGQPIGKLSGGERRRLYLLSVLMEAPNILLLDEPTNDLDVTTLAILEEYLETFPGAVIAVSHDRYFLDKMADQIFEVGEGGTIRRFVGNYSDYLEKRRQEERNQEKAEKKEKTARQEKPARQKKLKFTFKEQHEFETIEEDIAALEEQIAQVEEAMSAAGSDYVKLQELTQQQTALSAQLEEKMDRWVYLTDLAERIAAQE